MVPSCAYLVLVSDHRLAEHHGRLLLRRLLDAFNWDAERRAPFWSGKLHPVRPKTRYAGKASAKPLGDRYGVFAKISAVADKVYHTISPIQRPQSRRQQGRNGNFNGLSDIWATQEGVDRFATVHHFDHLHRRF